MKTYILSPLQERVASLTSEDLNEIKPWSINDPKRNNSFELIKVDEFQTRNVAIYWIGTNEYPNSYKLEVTKGKKVVYIALSSSLELMAAKKVNYVKNYKLLEQSI